MQQFKYVGKISYIDKNKLCICNQKANIAIIFKYLSGHIIITGVMQIKIY